MPQPTAVDAQGALSTGDNSNPAFSEPARVGDVAWADITPPVGYTDPDLTIFGGAGEPSVPSAAVGLSLDEAGPFSDGDTGLHIGAFTDTVRVWAKAQGICSHPRLIIPTTGFIAIEGAAGVAGSTSGASGSATEVEAATGTAGSTSGASGSAPEVVVVSGAAGSTSGATGDATDVSAGAPVSGSSGGDSGASGAATEVEAVAGSTGSGSGAEGSAPEVVVVSGSAGSDSGATGSATGVAPPPAGPQFRSYSSVFPTSDSATSRTIDAPAGLAAGDILIAYVINNTTNNTSSPPAATGFTALGGYPTDPGAFTSYKHRLWWKRVDTPEATYTFTGLSPAGALMAFSGVVATGDPHRDFTNTHDSTSDTNCVLGDTLDYLADDLVLGIMAREEVGQFDYGSTFPGAKLFNVGANLYVHSYAPTADGNVPSTAKLVFAPGSAIPHLYGLTLKKAT